MTETAQKIMELFTKQSKVKTGMVLSHAQLSLNAREWGQDHLGKIDHASEELSREGYVIITPVRGIELTDKGYFYLFNEV
jgi:hypothetical protein